MYVGDSRTSEGMEDSEDKDDHLQACIGFCLVFIVCLFLFACFCSFFAVVANCHKLFWRPEI